MQEIVAEMRAGRMVILVDEEDRENEGDLILASDHVTPEAINFMARHARGLICLTLSREMCERLKLPPMVARNNAQHATAFTVSIEAAEGVTTGISAADRSRTVQAAVASNATAHDLVQPGHIFPLQAVDGGVLMRAGHTEAGCDLAAMAGCSPAAVICEVMNEDGTMARLPDLQMFAAQHNLKIGTIADLIEHRSRTESLVEKVGSRTIQTAAGEFTAHAFRDKPSGEVHLALVKGQWNADDTVAVRVHEPLSVLDANQRLQPPAGNPFVSAVWVDGGPDVADQHIVAHAVRGDLVVTQDIPLAALLVPAGVVVLDPRGEEHTMETIGERLSIRDFMEQARTAGAVTGGPPPFDARARQAFASALDRALTRLLPRP